MTKNEVQQIMGPPAKSEFSGSMMAWHYCRTGYKVDNFVTVFFDNDKVTQVKNYSVTIRDTGGVTGDCTNFIRSVDFKPAVSSDDSLQKAKELNGEVIRLYQQGRYAEAIPIAERFHAIREKVLGPDHPDVAESLNNLALLYYTTGAYNKAEPLYRRSLAIYEKVLGADHTDVALSLNNLAELYRAMGSYDKAEPLYKRSLAIKEKVLRPDHPSTALALNNLATLYYTIGAYDKAEPLFKRSLAIKEKVLRPDHPDVALALNNLAELYHTIGAYNKAEPLYKRSLAIKEKVLGPDHPDVALALNNLATLYRSMGAYDKAEPLYERSLAIKEKILGPDHPDTAVSLNNLAALYDTMGSYEKVEPLYRRSLVIFEKALGPDHPSTANSLNNLALLYYNMGAYDKAKPLYKRSLVIREKVLGHDHPDVAQSLNNLAALYKAMGAYDKAEPLYERSLAIKEKILGPDHPDVALVLNNLAELYRTMGYYDKAEPLFKRSLAIKEKVLGADHPDIAQSLNNMALLYHTMGAYDKVEPLHRRSLAIKEKALGTDRPDVAQSLNNLASLYSDMGAYDKAEPLYKRSLTILEKALGTDHPDVAQSLNNLAEFYRTMGYYDKAEPLCKRSLAIREKIMGPEHPDTALSLNTLAALYYTMGAFDKAEPLFKGALAIREKALGPEHPSTATSLNNLALLYAAKGQNDESLVLMERAQVSDLRQIEQILGFAPEAQQTQFLATRENNLHAYFTLIRQHFPNNPKAIRNALDIWIARKGILLEAQKRIQDVLTAGDNPQAQEIFGKLTGIRQELARLVLGSPGKEGPEAYQKRIADLTSQKETLEGQLSRLSQTFAQQRKTRIATSSTVASALPKGAVLIEMARMKDFDFKTGKWGTSRYLAFVLSPGKDSDVSLVDLGEADSIDQQAAAFKKSLGNSKAPPNVLAKQSNDLHRLIFTPLTSALGKSRQIFLSPDGSLNLIPFEILRDDKGRYLIETHTFHYVSAGRDIAGYGMIKEKGQKTLLIGDPDFDLAAKQTTGEKERPLTRSRQMQGISFSRLPGTKEEVEAIAAILGRSASDTYTGVNARESVLMEKKSPRILHLATHGFFLSDQDWSSLMDDKSRGIAIIGKDKPSPKKPVRIENPFLRAGLALAGANRSLAQEGVTEGILTAEKILGLNLRGTDLVVLSACETGVGDIKNGEGVYGLRRAFTQAGAKSLVMSLWEVPDRETKELMVSFYKNLQSGKMNRAEALRHAALTQRETVKARYGSDNPYYWGAFVFLGEAE
ncbi:MAG: tetratricopeptide repeat protein [Desulfobacteria bacterium]